MISFLFLQFLCATAIYRHSSICSDIFWSFCLNHSFYYLIIFHSIKRLQIGDLHRKHLVNPHQFTSVCLKDFEFVSFCCDSIAVGKKKKREQANNSDTHKKECPNTKFYAPGKRFSGRFFIGSDRRGKGDVCHDDFCGEICSMILSFALRERGFSAISFSFGMITFLFTRCHVLLLPIFSFCSFSRKSVFTSLSSSE